MQLLLSKQRDLCSTRSKTRTSSGASILLEASFDKQKSPLPWSLQNYTWYSFVNKRMRKPRGARNPGSQLTPEAPTDTLFPCNERGWQHAVNRQPNSRANNSLSRDAALDNFVFSNFSKCLNFSQILQLLGKTSTL